MSGERTALRALEAALFAAEAPLSATELGKVTDLQSGVRPLLLKLAQDYADRGVNLVERGGRWHFQTAPDLAHLLRRERDEPRKLGRAAIETLAIIAYHEPASRAEIEAIRGVQLSRGTLDVLLEAGWIRSAGRRDAPGRPITYATTQAFLDHFGLASRRDLPGIEELRAAGLLDPIEMSLQQLEVETEGPEA